MNIQVVAEYPDAGFALLEDEAGTFLMFEEREEIVTVKEYLRKSPKAEFDYNPHIASLLRKQMD